MRTEQKETDMLYSSKYESPIGNIILISDESSLLGLHLEGERYFEESVTDEMQHDDEQPVIKMARAWLDDYFAGEQPGIAKLPLAPEGSAFRQQVWELLKEIPYGETTTYGKLAAETAKLMGKEKMSAQAVGGAVGHNPISIIIPCHRVVGTNGSLTGYGGGIDKKIKLLEHEGVDMSAMFVPEKGTAL